MTILDHHLPSLVSRAERLQNNLDTGCTKEYAEVELNKLHAYWKQLQELATQQRVWLGDYDPLISRLELALTLSRNRLEALVNKLPAWLSFLKRLVQVTNVVLAFFRLPRINTRLLTAAEQLLLPPRR